VSWVLVDRPQPPPPDVEGGRTGRDPAGDRVLDGDGGALRRRVDLKDLAGLGVGEPEALAARRRGLPGEASGPLHPPVERQ
jgi:hypothetical protein